MKAVQVFELVANKIKPNLLKHVFEQKIYTSECVPDKTSVSSAAPTGVPLSMGARTPSLSQPCRQHPAATHGNLGISARRFVIAV